MKTKLFISYSSDDEKHRITWDKQTAVLKNLDYIAPWHMRKILPGDKWDAAVRKEMEEADVMVLFISASFFASDYIWKVELARSKERFEAGECEIAIVIVEPCVWRVTWLKDVQALNGGQPISTAVNPAEAWARVVEDLMVLLEKVKVKKGGGL